MAQGSIFGQSLRDYSKSAQLKIDPIAKKKGSYLFN
jgi:hypothetical protein